MEVLTANKKAGVYTAMFRFQEGIFNNAFDNLTPEDALERPSGRSNHLNWLLGHILHCRYMLAALVGVQEQNPFGALFWDPITDVEYPSMEDIRATFPVISEKLLSKLVAFTDEELDAKPVQGQPSLSEIISFFTYHEAYHIGQLGYVRKFIGMGPLKSN